MFLGKNITPGRSGSDDRFIPNRSASQIELGQFLVSNAGKTSEDALLSPSKLQMQKAMSEKLNGDLANAKIMAYRQKPPTLPEGEHSLLLSSYSFVICYYGWLFRRVVSTLDSGTGGHTHTYPHNHLTAFGLGQPG